MMRSLFSGVSGLKSHQTRMDVIGNNIANVNTTGFKAKRLNFSDMLYQTTQAGSAANTDAQRGGINPRQIGLGVKTGAINTSITTEGASQSTGNPFDLKLTGEAFFIVSDGTNTYFTRDGSFDVDDAGYLVMASTGYTVMGWTQMEGETLIQSGSVSPINVYRYQTYNPAATTGAHINGIIDKFDDNLLTASGRQVNLQTYDSRGYEYNLKFGIKPVTNTVNGTKNVTNTERYYANLPVTIVLEDVSEITFRTESGKIITATGMPADLLNALKAEAGDNGINPNPGNYDDSTDITIDQDFLDRNNITDLGQYSELMGETVTCVFSGATAYIAYSTFNGIGDTTNVSLGEVTVSNTVLEQLYGLAAGATPTVNNAMNLAVNGLVVNEKKYTDGTDTTYEFTRVVGGNREANPIVLEYADISSLLALDISPVVQAQYTSREDTTFTQTLEGRYTIELLGMTDSDGNEIDITNLGNVVYDLVYNTDNGDFSYVGAAGQDSFTLNLSLLNGDGNFENLTVDMSGTVNVDNDKKSTLEGLRDNGRKVGTMTGISIGTDGLVQVNYSNGMSRYIAQIAVGTFPNAMGLENAGDNLYTQSASSGELSIVDIAASGTGYMTSGILEMSNVDLSMEFTEMITTQRGFQANSRTITVSDTLLEELINLKR